LYEGIKASDFTAKKTYSLANGNVSLTRAEVMSAAMHGLSEENKSHLTDGGFRTKRMRRSFVLTDADFAALSKTLTPKEKSIINGLKVFFDTNTKNAINEASLDVLGYEIADVDNYFPIVTDSMYRNMNMNKFKGNAVVEGLRFLKERTGGTNPIMIENIFDVAERTKNQVSYYYGYARALRNAKMMIGNSNIKQAVFAKFGDYKPLDALGEIVKQIDNVGRIDSSRSGVVGALSSVADFLISNYQKAVLGLNPGIALKQVASVPTAAAVLDAKYLPEAMLRKKTKRDIKYKYSPIVWYRDQGFVTREAGEAQKLTTYGKKKSKVTYLIQKADQLAIDAIWSWAEVETLHTTDLKDGTDAFYKHVAEKVNRTIFDTQPNYTALQRPELIRTDNQFIRLLTLFSTQRLQNYGLIYEGAAQTVNGIKGKKTSMVKTGLASMSSAIAGSIVVGLMTSVINKWRGYDDDWENEVVAALVGNVAFAGNIYNSLFKGYSSNNLIDQGVNDIVTSVNQLFSSSSTNKTLPYKIRKVIETLSQATGTPLKNLLRESETLLSNIDPYLAHQWNTIWYKEPEYYFSPDAQKIKEKYSKVKAQYEKAKESGTLTNTLKRDYVLYRDANDKLNELRRDIKKYYTLNLSTQRKKGLISKAEAEMDKVVKKFN
jgi:hypothetical protein